MTLFAACGLILAGMFFLMPRGADAAQTTSRLGGGNALLRATVGLLHASSTSDILAHLTFASTRGVPGTTSSQSSDGYGAGENDTANDTGGSTAGGVDGSQGNSGEPAPQGNANDNGGNPIGNSASSNGAGGGATAGNGGDGGNGGGAAAGGLVRAGNVVSNANASNAINVTTVRISR